MKLEPMRITSRAMSVVTEDAESSRQARTATTPSTGIHLPDDSASLAGGGIPVGSMSDDIYISAIVVDENCLLGDSISYCTDLYTKQ